jgi:uncharacterized protein
MTAQDDLPAGDFGEWIEEMKGALRGDHDAVVPCAGCTACCTSHQFVAIGPDEIDTLAHVPAELLVPAPRRPKGHFVLGYDGQGRCPMLRDNRCWIYAHRPKACRTYDCRVFAAADVEDTTKVEITRRVRRWRFGYPTQADRERHDAVRTAAIFVRDHAGELADEIDPTSAVHVAVAAIEMS